MTSEKWYNRYYNAILFTSISILTTIILPVEGKFKYEYQRGRPWMYETLIAPIDFPILKSDYEIREERASLAAKSPLCYRLDSDAVVSTGESLALNTDLFSIDIFQDLLEEIEYIFDKGVVDRAVVSNLVGSVIVNADSYNRFERPVKEVFTVESALLYLSKKFNLNQEQVLKIKSLMKPNLRFDNNATDLIRKEAMERISPTKGVVYAGEVIAVKGEVITAELEQIMDSYKAEYKISMGYSGSVSLLKLGQFILSLSIFVLLYVVLFFTKPDIIRDRKSLYFVVLLIFFSIVVTVLVKGINSRLLFVIPFPVFALYLCSFFNTKVVLPIYLVAILPLIVIAQNGYEIFMINLFAGSITTLAYSYWDKGWMQFAVAFIVFIVLSLTYSAYRVIIDGSILDLNPVVIGYFAWNAILIVAAYPLIYLFEKVFGLLSNQRLKDLADTDNAIMKEMAEKAPGTFQHVLQVANLAECGVSAIGGYSLLARVGALYHDLGKMSNPMIFIENQPPGSKNIHDDLDPVESAGLIIKHLKDGEEIAKREKLPKIIRDFILSHHGKSKAQYFYKKYISNGGDVNKAYLFEYDGIKPKYKEQVVVMMADAVEAASRSLRDYSEESISRLVEMVVEERISDGQLLEAEISLKEIKMVKDVFKQRLSGMYHSRMVKPL